MGGIQTNWYSTIKDQRENMEKLHIILLEILGGPRKGIFSFSYFPFRNNFLFIIFFVFYRY